MKLAGEPETVSGVVLMGSAGCWVLSAGSLDTGVLGAGVLSARSGDGVR